MTCLKIPNGIICTHSEGTYRLRLLNGKYIYMEWHYWMGPLFYKDKAGLRPIEDWYDSPDSELLNRAAQWFVKRGKKA